MSGSDASSESGQSAQSGGSHFGRTDDELAASEIMKVLIARAV
jgi:hypothetical protein